MDSMEMTPQELYALERAALEAERKGVAPPDPIRYIQEYREQKSLAVQQEVKTQFAKYESGKLTKREFWESLSPEGIKLFSSLMASAKASKQNTGVSTENTAPYSGLDRTSCRGIKHRPTVTEQEPPSLLCRFLQIISAPFSSRW